MSNGLLRRTFRVSPNAVTVAFDNLVTSESIIRGVKPEAAVVLNGRKFDVGGLTGQQEYAYLRPEWLDSMKADPAAFTLSSVETGPALERFAWKRKPYSPGSPWPPPGVRVTFHYTAPPDAPPGIEIAVHYEMYDGIPLICKWLTISNTGGSPVRLDSFVNEILALVEFEQSPDAKGRWREPNIHVESDYAFLGMMENGADHTTEWTIDPQYTTQVDYNLTNPALMLSRPPIGPDVDIAPGAAFESFRTFELVPDSTGRERRGLAIRRMYRTIAPWAMENPIFMHLRNADVFSVKQAVDQCAKAGCEMVILSFGSGFNIESEDAGYIAQIKKLAGYAHSKNIELGGYSLLASRTISDEDDVVDPKTMKPSKSAAFGTSPCIGSKWGEKYFDKLYAFFEAAGMDMLEHDGSYPGDVCASTKHPGHRGLGDSQWTQWKRITDFYKWCRARGIYLNVPDWYFLSGSNKTGMGYREVNWSLPRERQIILARQNIYDGTWEKTPSMGWMFVPLTEYHGGGEAATLEPLSQHLDAYGAHLTQNFLSGVQACYRGPRLYDTKETLSVVKKWIDFYKKHRAILDSDIIHIRRPDGRDIDAVLHVNPGLEEKGLLAVFNPLPVAVERKLRLPLYYTGLSETARISREDGEPVEYRLDRDYNVYLDITMQPDSATWFVIK